MCANMFYYVALLFHLITTAVFWKLFLAALLGFIWVLVIYVSYQHRRYDHIPGPPRNNFFLGHFTSLYACLGDNNVVSKYLYENVKKFGHTLRFFMFHRPFVVVVDPLAVRDILEPGKHKRCETTCKHDGYIFGARWQGSGLLTDYNEARLAQRLVALEPVFHKDYLMACLPELNKVAENILRQFTFLADGKTLISLSQQFERAIFDMLCKVFFNKDMDSITCQRDEVKQAVFSLLSSRRKEKSDPWTNVSLYRRDLRASTRQACALLRKTGASWLAERKNQVSGGNAGPKDVLTSLIELSKVKGITQDDVLDDFMVFMIATLEHTPNVLSFLVREACRRPEVYKKLNEEVDKVLHGKSAVDQKALSDLSYMDSVLRETLRLYPSDVEIIRITSSKVLSKGCVIPPGTPVIVSPLLSGREESFFDNPMEFNPERFVQNGHSMRNSSVYFPYADEVREKFHRFGEVSMKVLLSKMLQTLTILVFPDQTFGETNLPSLRPDRGGVVVFNPRSAPHKYIYDV